MARKSRKKVRYQKNDDRNDAPASLSSPKGDSFSIEDAENRAVPGNAQAPLDSFAHQDQDAFPQETDSTNSTPREPSAIQTESLHASIHHNTELIEQLVRQVASLQAASAPSPIQSFPDDPSADNLEPHPGQDPQVENLQLELTRAEDDIAELRHRNDALLQELSQRNAEFVELETQIEELKSQADDLAAQVTRDQVRETVSTQNSGSADAMTWEQRKQLILTQMENDTYDATAFVDSLSDNQKVAELVESADDPDSLSPTDFVNGLADKLQRAEARLVDREQEVRELQMLLQQQSETRDSGVAIGAAAIAQMVDADELVAQERERLQQLQDEWEEKFRAAEIAASLERAKLSRERQEVAKQNQELQEQMAHLKNEARQKEESGGATSRRWFAKLGLNENESD